MATLWRWEGTLWFPRELVAAEESEGRVLAADTLARTLWWRSRAAAALAGRLGGVESRKRSSPRPGGGMAESPAAAAVEVEEAAVPGPAGPGGGGGSPGVFIQAELWAAAGFGAPPPGSAAPPAGGAAPMAGLPAAGAALLSHSAFWDPTVSGDWDGERPSAACLLRIKRWVTPRPPSRAARPPCGGKGGLAPAPLPSPRVLPCGSRARPLGATSPPPCPACSSSRRFEAKAPAPVSRLGLGLHVLGRPFVWCGEGANTHLPLFGMCHPCVVLVSALKLPLESCPRVLGVFLHLLTLNLSQDSLAPRLSILNPGQPCWQRRQLLQARADSPVFRRSPCLGALYSLWPH